MLGSGWKGKAGGLGMILGGIAGLLAAFSKGELTAEVMIACFTAISAGVGVFGTRAAVESVEAKVDATKATVNKVEKKV